MERCLFGRAEILLPNLLTEDLGVFLEVVGVNTWQNVLTENERHNLMTLLPSFEQNDGHEKIQTLQKLFNGENFKFGNPLQQFHKSLREGRFSPEIAKYSKMIKRAKYKEYLKRQKLYASKLLKEVLVNRQRLLDAVSQMPPGENLKMEWWRMTDEEKPKANKCLELTVCKKYKTVIKEINEENGQVDTSSDEEDLLTECSRNPVFASALLQVEDFTPSVFGTLDVKPKLSNGGATVRPGKRSVSPVSMNEEAYFAMLRKHKKRRTDAYDEPALNTEGTTLEDVMARTYGKPAGKAKTTRGPYKKRNKKQKLEGSLPALWQPGMSMDDNAVDMADIKDEPEDDLDITQMYVNRQTYGQHGSFFGVLREFISEEQDSKITTFKIEQKVCDWQKSQCAGKNTWFSLQPSWSDVTLSALRLLAGHLVGVEMENFVPYLDYKERAQLWKWIGEGRDEDAQLQPFCDQWLQHVSREGPGDHREGMATPPPRSMTDYVVKPGDDEDKEVFQEQETMRFENPQQAFTYYMHGYESVVGPVKGVYDKPENDHPKARDHTLLVKERPPYVTILTLVRDAAARLPNGSGTRADICELLKYSQYLADHSADSLINSVVSGALDRLQYEKDPCVKYSSSRKIWIYLHRQRAEEDFNKIHQTHGKAAKAKQALAKPKAMKKSKEVLSQSLLAAPSSMPGNVIPQDRIFYPPQPQQSFTRIPATKMVEVSTGSSMSGLDILSSVAQSKISGSGEVQKVVPEGISGRVVKRIIPTASGPRMVSIARQVSSDRAPTSSLLASHLMGTSQMAVPVAQSKSKPVIAGSKPVAFSLLQSSTVSKLLESHGGVPNLQRQQPSQKPTKTVVVGSKQGFSPTISGSQSMIATLKQGSPSGAGQVTKTIVLEKNPHNIVSSQTISAAGGAGVSASHVIPAGSHVISSGSVTGSHRISTGSSAAGSKPVLARLIQQPAGTVGGHQVITTGSVGGQQVITTRSVGGQQVITTGSVGGQQVITTGSVGGQQVITLAGGQKAVVSSAMRAPSSVVTMSGTSLGQTIVQSGSRQTKPLILQRVSSAGLSPVATTKSIPSSPFTPSTVQSAIKTETIVVTKADTSPSMHRTAAHSIIQVPSMGKTASLGGKPIIIGGKPMTISTVGGKPVAIAAGKSVALSGGKPIQMGGKPITVAKQSPIQVGGKPVHIAGQTVQIGGKPVQISGKPVQFSGKPVQIGGKPVQMTGKPVQMTGKPVQIAGKPVQISGQPVQIRGQPVQIGGKPVQMSGKPIQIGGKPVQISMIQQQSPRNQAPTKVGTVVASSPQQSPVRSVGLPASQAVTLSQSVVNQLIQSGQLKAQPGTTVKAVSGSALQHVLSGGTLGGHQVKVQGQPVAQHAVKTVTMSGASVSEGGAGPKIVTVSQASMRAAGGQRIILQSQAGGGDIPQQQHVIAGKPTIQSASGVAGSGVRSGQNIQLVRSVVSQSAGKPGTTILVAQQGKVVASQPGTSHVQTIVTQSPGAGKGRGQPVYARIISPPSGVRLAAVRGQTPQGQTRIVQGQQFSQGQIRAVQSQGQIRTIQGVNLVQTVRSPSVGTPERTESGQ